MSQLVFAICSNPKEVGSNSSEGMEQSVRQGKQAKRASFLPPCPLSRLPPKRVAQIKGGPYHFKISGLKMSLPTSNYLIQKKKKILPRYTQLTVIAQVTQPRIHILIPQIQIIHPRVTATIKREEVSIILKFIFICLFVYSRQGLLGSLKLMLILLSQALGCQNYRHVPPYPA